MKRYRRHGLHQQRRKHLELKLEAERNVFSKGIQAELNGQAEPPKRPVLRRAADLFGVAAMSETYWRMRQKQKIEAEAGEAATASSVDFQPIPGEVLLPPPGSHEVNYMQDVISLPQHIRDKLIPKQ